MDYLDLPPWAPNTEIDPEFPTGSRQAAELRITALEIKSIKLEGGLLEILAVGPYVRVQDLKDIVKAEHPQWFTGKNGAMPSGPAIEDNTTGALLVPAEGGGAGDFGTISKVEPGP